jgi:acetone carboxylase gamma subunit
MTQNCLLFLTICKEWKFHSSIRLKSNENHIEQIYQNDVSVGRNK